MVHWNYEFSMAVCTKFASNFMIVLSGITLLYLSHPCYERHLAYFLNNTPDTPKWGCQWGCLGVLVGGVWGSQLGVSLNEMVDSWLGHCKTMLCRKTYFIAQNTGLGFERIWPVWQHNLVVVMGDNGGYHLTWPWLYSAGTASNYPLRGGKGNLYEGGTRVPTFVHSPLLKKKG